MKRTCTFCKINRDSTTRIAAIRVLCSAGLLFPSSTIRQEACASNVPVDYAYSVKTVATAVADAHVMQPPRQPTVPGRSFADPCVC